MIRRLIILLILIFPVSLFGSGVIRINQPGYFPGDHKVAVFLSDKEVFAGKFQIINSLSGEMVFESVPEKTDASVWGQQTACRLDFSAFTEPGGYRIQFANTSSPSFRITADVDKDFAQLTDEKATAADPFRIGSPFQWCSSNFIVAAATQARLYRQMTGDGSYLETETSLTDRLFGCNPWGTSMICGLPAGGDYPESPHSAITYLLHQTTTGGLIDGPVYRSIYENLRGIHLMEADEYEGFQRGKAVYHDDMGDYSSNEPTMDGTASLSWLLSSLETEGLETGRRIVKDSQGAVVRGDTSDRAVYLIFSAHDLNEGGEKIFSTLKKHNVKASFFLTGEFYADKENQLLIDQLVQNGHFMGAHSDQHLLYADWTKRDSSLIDRTTFESDLKENYRKMNDHGIDVRSANYFLPPYEWYNKATVDWAAQMGLTVVNFTPGIRTNADYTTPDMPNYLSSDAIMENLKAFEKNDPHGLNGCIILIHLGTQMKRTDKFYDRLGELLTFLKKKGYRPDKLSSINHL